LEGYFGKPIIDQTGLTQHFSIDLKWDPRSPAGTDAVKQVMLKKLGLVLVPSRESVEVLVVERAK
jgi:uncharacterized protein (TIGR03435 family)